MATALSDTYADATPHAAAASAPSQFVTFTCGERAFGVDIMAVREIRSWSSSTELPGSPAASRGVLDIRGSIVQVYDLETLLGGYGSGQNGKAGQVVLVVSLDTCDAGLLVDTVSDIIFAHADDLRPVPATNRSSNAMVSGLVKNEDRLIAILNLATMFPDA